MSWSDRLVAGAQDPLGILAAIGLVAGMWASILYMGTVMGWIGLAVAGGSMALIVVLAVRSKRASDKDA